MVRSMLAVMAFTLLAVGVLAAEKPACKAEKAKLTELQEEAAHLQAKLTVAEADLEKVRAQQGGKATKLSVLGAASSAKDMIGSAVQHALDSTELDEKAARHFGTAKTFAVDAMGKVSAIDYTEHINKLKDHSIYKQHVAPAMDAATKKAEPYVAQYVQPAMDKHVNPAWDKAKTTFFNAADTVHPVFQEHKSKVFERLSGVPSLSELADKLGEALNPVFALLVFFYYSLFLAKFVVLVSLKVTANTTSVTFNLAVLLPLRIVAKVLGVIACFATCFYCCGLCRRKSAPTNSNKDAAKQDKSTARKDHKQSEKVKVDELIQLLEASKKKGKIDDAVKLICTKEKEGKPLEGKSFPENVRGKTVDKATLKKACSNFKEIDLKKL